MARGAENDLVIHLTSKLRPSRHFRQDLEQALSLQLACQTQVRYPKKDEKPTNYLNFTSR